jgi:preprotein translocase subunit SecA
LRLANSSLSDLDDQTRRGLEAVLGDELSLQVDNKPLHTVTGPRRDQVVDELGRRALTEIYRQLILGVVTELWVDYLTQMEALRVAIGLEAYAQRDPLVQYKSRAFGLFQDLLSNMRLGVVTRMFTYRPRDLGSVQASTRLETPQLEIRPEETEPEENPVTEPETDQEELAEPVAVAPQKSAQPAARNNQDSASKKRRRRRH